MERGREVGGKEGENDRVCCECSRLGERVANQRTWRSMEYNKHTENSYLARDYSSLPIVA